MSSIIILGVILILLSGFFTAFQIYQLIALDAHYRGMKHPKGWAALASMGQRGDGLILYLLKRRNYPRQKMTIQDADTFLALKKRALIGLFCQLFGAIIMVYSIIFINQ